MRLNTGTRAPQAGRLNIRNEPTIVISAVQPMACQSTLANFIDGKWQVPAGSEVRPVHNPATAAAIAAVPLSNAASVDAAARGAEAAFASWSRVPAVERVQFLFKFKTLLEQHLAELARTIV